jgi:integrase
MREIVEDLVRNPFEGIDITGGSGIRAAKDRRAFEVSELNRTLSSPLYLDGVRIGGQVVEAAYWLPILGPFVGGRIEELCQLRVNDVQRVNGSWCVRLCDLDENQELKNDNSFRRVPLHEAVIRCGFLLHVATMARAGHTRVFPSLCNDNSTGTFSNAAGKWFARFLDSIGLTDSRLDYHSYRYCFRQQCSLSGIENEQRDALTGHWSSKGDGASAYLKRENAQYPYPKLAAAIAMLVYDGLRIEHLFVQEPLAGVTETLLG